MRIQTEIDLSLEVPDRCGNNCSEKSRACALSGALYVARLVFENADKIESLEDATVAKANLDSASDVLRRCDVVVHDEGINPITSTMDLSGNVTFCMASDEVFVQIQRPNFVDVGDVFGRDL